MPQISHCRSLSISPPAAHTEAITPGRLYPSLPCPCRWGRLCVWSKEPKGRDSCHTCRLRPSLTASPVRQASPLCRRQVRPLHRFSSTLQTPHQSPSSDVPPKTSFTPSHVSYWFDSAIKITPTKHTALRSWESKHRMTPLLQIIVSGHFVILHLFFLYLGTCVFTGSINIYLLCKHLHSGWPAALMFWTSFTFRNQCTQHSLSLSLSHRCLGAVLVQVNLSQWCCTYKMCANDSSPLSILWLRFLVTSTQVSNSECSRRTGTWSVPEPSPESVAADPKAHPGKLATRAIPIFLNYATIFAF